ncbi:MAG: pilus assembly protein PilM [Betaproteobacteria bacterium RBG_16_58_11]|nr:MAG: pilus assembly protein PilM [Betaproteobacteria bacterium RBG_16_58_11]
MLANLFQSQSPPLIGVDISSSAVKMVEIEQAGKNLLRVERYAIESLPKDAVTDGNIMNLEAVAETMRRAWKRMGTRIKNVSLALPAAAVITKKIIVPAGLREDELEAQVETEANQYIPFALDEVNLDFQVLGPSPSGPEDVEVLIAASRKEKVEDRVAAAESAGLKAVVVDVESYATQTACELVSQQLPNAGRDQTVAVVDIGAAMMHINVLHNGQSIYMREQSFGGNQLTQEIQRRYSLSSDEAEIAKRQGGLPENYEAEVLQPFMDTLALEVARAIQFFFSSSQFNRVDHILLAGGCAMIPGLDEIVATRAQSSTMIANPFASMALSSRIKPKQLTLDAPALLIACGLAMRRFDK